MTEATKQKICELAKAGMSDKAIAEIVFYSPSYVEAVRLERGCLRPHTEPKKYPVDEIKRRLRAGDDPHEIAKDYGCTFQLVCYHRKRMDKEE